MKLVIIAKFDGTYLITCSHSREGKTPSYSRINTVVVLQLVKVPYGSIKSMKVLSKLMQNFVLLLMNETYVYLCSTFVSYLHLLVNFLIIWAQLFKASLAYRAR